MAEQIKAARLAKATAKAAAKAAAEAAAEAAEVDSEKRWPTRAVEQEERSAAGEAGEAEADASERCCFDYRRISMHTDAACNTCFEGRSLF